jgi:hypothetical protein
VCWRLLQLSDAYPVNSPLDDDLGMLAIADIAAEDTDASFQRTRSPALHVGVDLAADDTARRVLRWLALRGSPPGNRALPDMLGFYALAGAWRQIELQRVDRRIDNTIAALQRRQRAVRRAIRSEIVKHTRAEEGARRKALD